ncbi:sialidase family protein [Mucilaginibacter boryungensis]|uniref:Exo-alpha-sialidase n=1 Tax=Mucilaginibacter boryungensis TaxID=768480 RepID=A0ABR9XFE7_9SPHI|nr:sialidase family protein [Mucilaginibacter boryungensis]MBE9666119.1 exo-alpha-sialidase [Mucilaginibacter boryungensis]
MMRKDILFFVCGCLLFGCNTSKKVINNVQTVEEPGSRLSVPLVLEQGVPVYSVTKINYKRNNKPVFNILFGQPVVVSVASKPEKWGFFQFPKIGYKQNGLLQAKWNMKPDAMSAYGMDNSGSATSADGGKTWNLQEKDEITPEVTLPNGDKLQIFTPKPIKTDSLNMPKPLLTGASTDTYNAKTVYNYYRLNDLPANCQAVYIKRLKKGETEWKDEQDKLYDAKAARHTTKGLLPVVWWGDMHIANDGSVIAGIYPGSLIRDNGTIDPKSGVFFYRSTDNGHSWYIQGRIPYHADTLADVKGNKRMGFTEPAFEILKDGTFLCVIRTTDGVGIGPMYASYSKDMGKTWTKPRVIAANGVLPRLLQLDNGVVVLCSGRPGVQLRFSENGKGDTWTEPFEMLPFVNEKDEVSCGYTGLIPTGEDSFLMVYSDFKYKTPDGNIRKAIKVRQVTVKPN